MSSNSKVKPALVRDPNHDLVAWYATQKAMTVPEVYRKGAALLIYSDPLSSTIPKQEPR